MKSLHDRLAKTPFERVFSRDGQNSGTVVRVLPRSWTSLECSLHIYQTPVTLGGFWTSPSVSDPVLGYYREDGEVQPRPQVYPPWNTSRHFANDVVLLDS